MNKIATAFTALALALSALLMASPAQAHQTNYEGCVTKAEYDLVRKGMHQARVAHLFETRGEVIYREGRYQRVAYRSCAPRRLVTIDYMGRLVTEKHRVWVGRSTWVKDDGHWYFTY